MSSDDGNDVGTPSTAGGGGGGGGALLNQPIVIDTGTATTKAGFAGGSKPKVCVNTKVGRVKHMRVMPGGALEHEGRQSPSSVFVGQRLDDHRGAFKLEYPMEKGHVVDGGWDSMERIWEHVYSKANLNAKTDEYPTLLTEAPLNPYTNRERTAEIFFETLSTPALFFTPPAVLSLYASGRTTGVVLDVGEGLSHCVPVYEGYSLKHSISRSDVGGRDVTNQMQLLLRRGGVGFTTTAENDLVKGMKEEACYVSLGEADEDGGVVGSSGQGGGSTADRTKTSSKAQYQLPDGQAITLSSERYMAPEILFRPSLIGSEEMGVQDLLLDTIMKSDLDLRPTLFSQIVLAGGSTLTHGFGDRLLVDVRTKAPVHTRIRISAPPERVNSAWVGGSILASLATFKTMWVSRGEYEEHGNRLLHRGAL